MAASERRPGRRRRRVTRPSTAENYDRSFDAPSAEPRRGAFGGGNDALRNVALDDESDSTDDELTGEAFYRDNMPPHFGTTQ